MDNIRLKVIECLNLHVARAVSQQLGCNRPECVVLDNCVGSCAAGCCCAGYCRGGCYIRSSLPIAVIVRAKLVRYARYCGDVLMLSLDASDSDAVVTVRAC